VKTHYGMSGMRACTDTSALGETTQDIQAVGCLDCLFNVWGQHLAACDIVANRIREVATDRHAVKVVVA